MELKKITLANLDTLSDLEINMQVALIEGHRLVSDSISHNLIPCELAEKSCPPPVAPDAQYLRLFDILKDDELCFRLMLKYRIRFSENSDGVYVAMYSHSRGCEHTRPTKAIALAIIEKHLKSQ